MTADAFPARLLRAGSFWELVTARAAASGDAAMLIDASGHVISFKEFKDCAERMAATLSARGVGPGSRVAWQLPTRVSTVIVMAALARLGAVQAPVIPIYRERETGAAVATAVFWSVREEMGVTVAHDYGMTEVPMICVASPLDTDEQLANSDGRPIPGNEVRIVDGTEVLPAGADGEIQVRGAAVCHGYTDPSLDSGAFTADGWFRTGDRGHLRPDGHVEVTGRTKDLIIRKGEKIAPLELETLLIQHPAVAEVAVLGLPDAERGERACAVLTLRPGAGAPSLAEVTAFLRAAGLMPQKLPEQVEIVSELPRTGLGKVAKLALRDKFSG